MQWTRPGTNGASPLISVLDAFSRRLKSTDD